MDPLMRTRSLRVTHSIMSILARRAVVRRTTPQRFVNRARRPPFHTPEWSTTPFSRATADAVASADGPLFERARTVRCGGLYVSPSSRTVLPGRAFALHRLYQTEWKRESGQSGGGHRFAAGLVRIRLAARPPERVSKAICLFSHSSEEVLLAFGKQFKVRCCGRIARPSYRRK